MTADRRKTRKRRKKKKNGQQISRFYWKKRVLVTGFFFLFLLVFLAKGVELEEISLPDQIGTFLENTGQRLSGSKSAKLAGKISDTAEYLVRDLMDRVKENQEELHAQGDLTVWFFDVGQGSAALAESDGSFLLVDGGDFETAAQLPDMLRKRGVSKLDYLVLSHYDSDHLAGAVEVLKEFPTAQILGPDYKGDTELYETYENLIKEKGILPEHPKAGERFSFGEASFQVVGPLYYGHEDENDDSLCIRLLGGGASFLFCGDAGSDAEEEMERGNQKLSSDVYVVNHHGSSSSTEEDFFDRVDPKYAVISCGKDNQYGHPAKRVLNLLKKAKTEVFRTDRQGTIKAVCQGGDIRFSVSSGNGF